MKDFFTLEGKIEENRRFLKETQDKYEKIRSYYPLFFIYVGIMGLYTFNILTYVLSNGFGYSNLLLGGLLLGHVGLFIYVFYLFSKILILKPLYHENPPKTNYCEYKEKFIQPTPKNTIYEINEIEEKNKKLYEVELEDYLFVLEKSSEHNFNVYESKKLALSKVIKYSIYSFMLYISLITFYKIGSMKNQPTTASTTASTGDSAAKVTSKKELRMIMDSTQKKGNVLNEKKDGVKSK
jgi:hypothetical protein